MELLGLKSTILPVLQTTKPQKFLLNFCGFLLLLIGNNADDGINSAFHGF